MYILIYIYVILLYTESVHLQSVGGKENEGKYLSIAV